MDNQETLSILVTRHTTLTKQNKNKTNTKHHTTRETNTVQTNTTCVKSKLEIALKVS